MLVVVGLGWWWWAGEEEEQGRRRPLLLFRRWLVGWGLGWEAARLRDGDWGVGGNN